MAEEGRRALVRSSLLHIFAHIDGEGLGRIRLAVPRYSQLLELVIPRRRELEELVNNSINFAEKMRPGETIRRAMGRIFAMDLDEGYDFQIWLNQLTGFLLENEIVTDDAINCEEWGADTIRSFIPRVQSKFPAAIMSRLRN